LGGDGAGGGGSGATSTASGTGAATSQGGNQGSGGGGAPLVDLDLDGIDDGVEAALALEYLPFISIHPDDECSRHGVIYRLSPHPDEPSYNMIWYDVLYELDCGLNGHVGDNETFSVVIDPEVPAPAGILAVRAISHEGTLCEQTTTCGSLTGCGACDTAEKRGVVFPVVFSSKNKHGGYVDEGTCDLRVVCDFGGCAIGTFTEPPLVNVGEPDAPLVSDLTAEGFINAANGWTESSLMDYDPWGGADFGDAGNVAGDLDDPAQIVSPSGC